MEKIKIKKAILDNGKQVKVGKGKLLFFSEDSVLLQLTEDEINNYDIVGDIDYAFAYSIKKGFPGFTGGK